MTTRRTVLRTGLAAVAAGLYAPALRAQSRERIRAAFAASGPKNADPIVSSQGADQWAIKQMFETLAAPPDGHFGVESEDFEPLLAESWSASDDARSWVFQLRRGVQFHKGYGEMTGDDVVFTFERAKATGARKGLFANVESVVANSPTEVTFNLTSPDPLFLGNVIFAYDSAIVSKKAVEEKGEGFGSDPVGTGPYQLVNFDVEKGVFLNRFDGYWGEPAKVADVDILYIADTTARTLALLSGDVDMIEGARSPGWIPSIQSQNPNLLLDMTAPGSFVTFFFNLTREPLNDLRVRQAVAYAINKEDIVRAMSPLANISYTLDPPGYPTGWAREDLPEEVRYDHNPDRARELLKDAGFANGFDITVNASAREDYSTYSLIIQEQLRAVGINIDLKIMDHSAYHAENRKDLNTMPILSWSQPPVPLAFLPRCCAADEVVKADSTGGFNLSHYGVAMPGVDDKLDAMRKATSLEEHIEIGRQLELQVARDLPMIGLPTTSYVVVRNPRLDLGFEVKSGYAVWRLNRATFVG